jgi:hypothetical protein
MKKDDPLYRHSVETREHSKRLLKMLEARKLTIGSYREGRMEAETKEAIETHQRIIAETTAVIEELERNPLP